MLFQGNLVTSCPIRQKIRDFYRIDENLAVDHILPDAEVSVGARSRAWERARKMVLRIRREQEGHGGVDALLNEYSLSTAEGVVLMCLAEALLRVPDKKSQDALIRDKLSKGAWSSHLGTSDSIFVNASSWGLLLTGNMVSYTDHRKRNSIGLLKKTLGKMGEPVIRKAMNIAMKVMGKQFVMGENIDDALKRAAEKEQQGYVYSYDMLGEGARTAKDAQAYYDAYEEAIHAIGKAANKKGPKRSPGISVKLSAIHPRYEFTNREEVLEVIPKLLKQLCMLCKDYDIGLTVDAEEADRLDISLDIIEKVFSDPDLGDWSGFGLAVQAYQKRSLYVLDWLRDLTLKTGRTMMVRLVKGAYWDTEIKNAQQAGLEHFPVFTRKSSTDVSYHACANRLLAYKDTIYPQFATHNAYTASVILELAGDDKEGFEFQCLHGMGDSLYDQIVVEEKVQCRVYAPVGEHEDLLAYLVRRLLENGANSSFVNAIVDDSKPVEDLLEDPVEKTQRLKFKYNQQILKPIDLYGAERANSKGLDLTDINHIAPLKLALDRWQSENCVAQPEENETIHVVRNPAKQDEAIGHLVYDSPEQIKHKLELAERAFQKWSNTPVETRAEVLRRTADALERNSDELMALCLKEAGKIAQDAIDEIREAVDFCRYYAARAEELSEDNRLSPRGVVLCISPWNFPLAIFLGQVVAALVTGNTVLAKPAEQTSLIAIRAVELMENVGLPKGTLQTLVNKGPVIGDVLLPDSRIKAVIFTGSTQTGSLIAKELANRGTEQVPLIAETGGQNCMIVDSTALPEQVIDDVIASGFQSAGQRCSALRVLFLQEDIADTIIEMLIGAMQELRVGDPSMLSTDIGPVIDQKALNSLQQHVIDMQGKAKLLYDAPLPEDCKNGFYFTPKLYEIDNIDVLTREVFGPCVHIVRFKEKDTLNVIQQINGTGFGLTMGVHSRIDEKAMELGRLSRAGNVYINRNMIGAIVGVQPFGGRGLSGTGPKAGGPNYLPRLMIEKATPLKSEVKDELQIQQVFEASGIDESGALKIMNNAAEAEFDWRSTNLTSRISWVRQLLAKLARVDILDDLAEDLDQTLAVSRAQLIKIQKMLKAPTELPGPTGESNTLYLEPRGVLLCYADEQVTFEYWALSIVTALATGNVVIAVVSDLFYDEATEFVNKWRSIGAPEAVLQVAKLSHLQALLDAPQLAGVVIDSQSHSKAYLAQKLAQREGAILPVITSEYSDNLIQRLLTEKTISIDTTASGGNTKLMTLEESDD
ncbi:bifunctional proline dehydrogenase/L-glutamate gamma-semialdehyde dehydrogenase PutA [Aliiglaciecola sp. 2_MG-2023]|uniref:bifunctional proline dehydrogenase/L-glutamate gamma-semialdehyde dehydrogenase PutA n=1 Tax=unclassified Aliiglaciecola TaxID=2593648 RepID=UPI0026E2DF70|nr:MULTISPECIES: bifunctional proline dehydrogenase/L-glutamate gamma-semialdehyde dehydrogenase PutA [unclassified Aliiglaciecola]MDO6711332.1 bifunctional proline dehydrogenase/L-glutamate gamma-semialdehyde dehydrogenase PutA [Aliiglaciecola sp. 2_MG-2023]MDO6752219.1 bifunctional proline dehydrogenase/L-glutamate gamma-semialdehyde dehydrogenase PutA [Aliiglaciecola sp. 1_MG-2023]